MRPKMGNEIPKMGNSLPIAAVNGAGLSYEQTIAAALRQELGGTNKAIKTLVRWTGAHDRTVKNWLSGSAGPSGTHLIRLMRSSDIVFDAVLKLAGRDRDMASGQIAEAGELLKRAVRLLERLP
ncbi:MAG TPA: hypothetical protein VGF97_09860 [Rhizomicrobium sp.]|jgi:hypothetical protein